MSKFNPDLIQSALSYGKVQTFEQLDSTNEYLLNHYHHLPSGSLCLAESQTAGRGRRGRQWYSPQSENLYFSMLWQYDLSQLSLISPLSLVVALTIAEAFEQQGISGIQIKWPNDIYYQGKKMGGILIESRTDGADLYLVIGIGLNLAMPTIDDSIVTQPWADLSDFRFDRNQLTAHLARLLQQMLIEFPHTPFTEYLPRWKKFDCYDQQPVKLLTEKGEIHGIAKGINAQGELLLQQGQTLTAFAIGEISLRADC